MSTVRIGMMGFGQIGRQLYKLALQDERFEVVAISDIGRPEILQHLLDVTMGHTGEVQLVDNYLVSATQRTRLMSTHHPIEIPWDMFNVDVVIDATPRFRSAEELAPHLSNGAKRVFTTALPEGDIDRVVLYGVNHDQVSADDRIISAGSASTTATALALKIIAEKYQIEHATMTSVHAYTSDQSLQDYAGLDYRRSRSGAKNIIPNDTPALYWVQEVMPALKGKMSGYALNVPVQTGSMLDITVALKTPPNSVDEFRELFIDAASRFPSLISTINDPIVSSDVIGDPHSLLVDLLGTMLAGKSMVKLLGWHESLAHAHRILDVVACYSDLEPKGMLEAS
ncbi:MAG: glyceraldehyde 3-phosphate dehydrogenase [Flavobacterium sp.]|jgi:glyceraldehyde 3-phosphate dehydrogenase